jgi:putative ABC transport system permease protein
MKYLRLVWSNLTRKKVRTTLTIGSFVVALFLYGLLVTIRTAFSGGVDVAAADRLSVINKTSLILPLPISYRDRIAGIEGVRNVTYATWFGGVYQDERNFFPQFAVDPATWFDVYPDYAVPEVEKQAFLADRQAALVGRALAKRFGFQVGDRIPLRGTIWPGSWEFNVAGIYDGSRPDVDTSTFLFRYDFLEETRQFAKSTVGWYVVRLDDPDDAVRVTAAIDDRFANSPYETLVLVIGSVVFFTLLLVAGNTMAIAVRERTGELAVLKTVGYSDRAVLGLVLAEALLIAGQGGLIGLLLAKGFTSGGDPTGGMLGTFYLGWDSIVLGFLLTLAVGGMAGMLPAVAAMRLRVVEALRRV